MSDKDDSRVFTPKFGRTRPSFGCVGRGPRLQRGSGSSAARLRRPRFKYACREDERLRRQAPRPPAPAVHRVVVVKGGKLDPLGCPVPGRPAYRPGTAR
jgi:hypothetical protein